jgi:hypothetical protein
MYRLSSYLSLADSPSSRENSVRQDGSGPFVIRTDNLSPVPSLTCDQQSLGDLPAHPRSPGLPLKIQQKYSALPNSRLGTPWTRLSKEEVMPVQPQTHHSIEKID